MPIVLAAVLLLLLPNALHAGALVNEVAWMGTVTSANDEWIELRNADDAAVSLEGWSLVSKDGSLSIPLSGSIPAGGYFLLERSDDSTVPSVTADLIYTGSISNSGEILLLKNSGGTTVDTVDGSDNWKIGGNNETKETLQRSGSGFVTAAGTPRSQNASAGSPPPVAETKTTSSKSSSSSSNSGSTASASNAAPAETGPSMTVSAGEDRNAVVGADTLFEAVAYGKEGKPIPSATYSWSFGDGTTGEGARIFHRYRTPGDFVVMVSAGNIDAKVSVTDRIVAHARKAEVALSILPDAILLLRNEGDQELDVSGWILTGAGKQFTLPQNTHILAEGEVRFAPEILGFSGAADSALWYPSGVLAVQAVLETESTPRDVPVAAPVIEKSTEEPAVPLAETAPKSAAKRKAVQKEVPLGATALAAEAASAVAPDAPSESGSLPWWLLGLAAILGTGAAAVLFARQAERVVEKELRAEDFTIVE